MKHQIMQRCKLLSLEIIFLSDELPNKPSAWVLSKQVLRSSGSVAANYRAAVRAKSRNDLLNKLKIVEEEADETLLWLELLEEGKIVKPERVKALKQEAHELTSIMVASIKTLRKNI